MLKKMRFLVSSDVIFTPNILPQINLEQIMSGGGLNSHLLVKTTKMLAR